MIIGSVNSNLEAIIPISIYGLNNQIYTIDGILDTGFDGWLSLSPDLVTQLNLTWKRQGRAILADGSESIFNSYEAVILWDGVRLTIPIDEANSEPLVGISLMSNYQLIIQIFPEGKVELQNINTI